MEGRKDGGDELTVTMVGWEDEPEDEGGVGDVRLASLAFGPDQKPSAVAILGALRLKSVPSVRF